MFCIVIRYAEIPLLIASCLPVAFKHEKIMPTLFIFIYRYITCPRMHSWGSLHASSVVIISQTNVYQ